MDAILPLLPIAVLMYEEEQSVLRRNFIRNNRSNAFALPDVKFVSMFRLNKRLAHELIEDLRSLLEPASNRRNVLTPEVKVLCALRFFATGSYQNLIGQDDTLQVSQKSVSHSIRSVADAINNVLFRKWIKFPSQVGELTQIASNFFDKFEFPGIVGAIDCTHVAIIAPSGRHEESNYVNRKNFHSLNVQVVCDVNCKILNISARFPGSTHDAFIWRSSAIYSAFENGTLPNDGSVWLLGDSGYPLEPWLMVPLLNPQTGPEERFNECHSSARSTVERCNGILKGRFRCLLKHRVLNYDPVIAAKIINSCAVLHNMCLDANIFWDDYEEDVDDFNTSDFSVRQSEARLSDYKKGEKIRRRLIENRFC